MTTQEIKDLIMSKIAGQGSAVDAGSALPEILNGIVDAIGQGGGGLSILRLNPNDEISTDYERTGTGFSSLGALLGITAEQARDLVLRNKYAILEVPVLLTTDGGHAGWGLTMANTAVIWDNTHYLTIVNIPFPQIIGDKVDENINNVRFNNEPLEIKYWEDSETWYVYFG